MLRNFTAAQPSRLSQWLMMCKDIVEVPLTVMLLATVDSAIDRTSKVTRLLSTVTTIMLLASAWTPSPALAVTDLEARRGASVSEFERLSTEIGLSETRRKQLAEEIAQLRKDNASMTAALIQAAKTEKKLAEDVEAIETRLGRLHEQQAVIKSSLAARRGVLAEVLGALQRIGLNPPPAILVSPEDALGSVRSAILLGAIVPRMRQEAEVLLADLKELQRVGESIASERQRLVATMANQAAERGRLSLLLEERKKLQVASEADLGMQQETAAKLAARARSLKDLIGSLEKEIDKTKKAAEVARLAEEERLRREELSASSAVPEVNRLAVAKPFTDMTGNLSTPVSGPFVRRFGGVDDAGVETFGDTLRTQSGAIVTAPSDATVLYAGPFRSYGQLLILDAGDGYHVVLAGMGRIAVSQGQRVLAGEPVGAMGDTRVASAQAEGSLNLQPELYIEFRKDQKPVDPSPWWAERQSGRTGHDS
jgi:septal ring factor EnvC (AmiA/AmiB activator)